MSNDSSTGGYLAPGPPLSVPVEGKPLYDFVSAVIVGVTGLASGFVRPAFQAEPPVVPDAGAVWASFSIDDRTTPTFSYEQHVPGSPSYSYVQQQEELNVLVRFYGLGVDGGADAAATTLRDGLQVAQNREALQLAGWALVGAGPIRPVPSLDAQRWTYRVDLPIVFRRELDVSYPVLDVASMVGTLQTDTLDSNHQPFSESLSATNP